MQFVLTFLRTFYFVITRALSLLGYVPGIAIVLLAYAMFAITNYCLAILYLMKFNWDDTFRILLTR